MSPPQFGTTDSKDAAKNVIVDFSNVSQYSLDIDGVDAGKEGKKVPHGLGPTGRRRPSWSLPSSASLQQLVRLAHHRWAIEQHYQDLKTELGLDHFEGRSYPGWQHHMAISAVATPFSKPNGCGLGLDPG